MICSCTSGLVRSPSRLRLSAFQAASTACAYALAVLGYAGAATTGGPVVAPGPGVVPDGPSTRPEGAGCGGEQAPAAARRAATDQASPAMIAVRVRAIMPSF